MFQDLIRDSYGHSLLNNKDRRVIDEIRWCTEKGFIQQALTLVESKMPAVFLKNGFLISEKQKEEKNGQKAVTAFSIFNSKSKDPVLSDDFLSYITQKNSPKKGWESAENYIVQAVGISDLVILEKQLLADQFDVVEAIVLATLLNHFSDQVEDKGGMNPEAFAVTDASV